MLLDPNEIEFEMKGVNNQHMSPLFQAVVEATEEAIVNSLLMATSVNSRYGLSESIPLERTQQIIKKYGRIHR